MDYAVIVAGGRGTRMGGPVPKQFAEVGGRPVLMRTIERFRAYDPRLNIIVVLPRSEQYRWRGLCEEHGFAVEHLVADGGASRFESSRNGLALVPDNADGVVAFHDGVRPFVSVETIGRCFAAARESGAAVPVVPVTDTLRLLNDDGGSQTVARSLYRAVQTPQVFSIALAKRAFAQPESRKFTDDASVVEAMGVKVSLVEGNRENIKLTTPFDLTIAQCIIHGT